MAIRHLTGHAEFVTIQDRYSIGQSYSRTWKQPCVISLPGQSRFYQTVIHSCYDNFDLDKETPSGSGTNHSTHDSVIQELRDPDTP